MTFSSAMTSPNLLLYFDVTIVPAYALTSVFMSSVNELSSREFKTMKLPFE